MATNTPKIGLPKPTPNVETDYGFRQNEAFDILDDAVLVANTTGAGTVTVTDDGSGNVTISGTAHPSDSDTVSNALVGADGITVTSGSNTDTLTGFRTEFVNASGTLQADIDAKADQSEFVSASGSLQTQIDAGSPLTVKETDGSPLVTNVNTIIVTTGTLTDNGGGEVSIVTGGGGGGGSTSLQQAYDNGDGTIASTSAKPIQTGDLTATGTLLVREGASNTDVVLGRSSTMGIAFRDSGSDIINFVLDGTNAGFANQSSFGYYRFRPITSTEGTPGIAFNTDGDTGIHFDNANSISLIGGGTSRLTASGVGDNTDGVGINGNLTVTGTVAAKVGEFEETLTVSGIPVDISGGGGSALTVKETDGSPLVNNVSTIVVTTGTLTDDGGGQVTIDTGGGGGGSAAFRGAKVSLVDGNVDVDDVTVVDLTWQVESVNNLDYDTDGFLVASGSPFLQVPADVTKVRCTGQVLWDSNVVGHRTAQLRNNADLGGAGFSGAALNTLSLGSKFITHNLSTPIVTVTGGTQFKLQAVNGDGGPIGGTGSGDTREVLTNAQTWFSIEVIE